MSRPPGLELADVFRRYGSEYRRMHSATLLPEQRRVMRAITACRTAELGGHVDECDACAHRRISYNSCRNRHCPKCQSLAKAQWLAARQAELLPVTYYHVVFTIPEQLAAIALQNKRVVYELLFNTTAKTLQQIAADPRHLGAEIGFLAVLHTWGQNLLHHPHIHCVVPGGGLSLDGSRWITCREKFFLPVRVLSRLFRRLFLTALEAAFKRGELVFHGQLSHLSEERAFMNALDRARGKEWVVYAKQPFGGPAQVLDYLGRYTHRVAISNHRLISAEEGRVCFRWKDYRKENGQRVMTLQVAEFIRRFLLHVLPRGFQRIRHYGLLANRSRAAKLERCRQLLGAHQLEARQPTRNYQEQYGEVTGHSLERCPICGEGKMRRVELLSPAPKAAAGQATKWPRAVQIDSS